MTVGSNSCTHCHSLTLQCTFNDPNNLNGTITFGDDSFPNAILRTGSIF